MPIHAWNICSGCCAGSDLFAVVQVISREPGGNLYAKFDPRKNGAPTGEKGFCHSFIRQFTGLILTRFITLYCIKTAFL